MAVVAEKQLFQVQLGNANATLYTQPGVSNGQTKIKSWRFANTDAAARTITIDIVPAGGAAGIAVRIVPTISIPANTVFGIDQAGDIVPTGGTVQGLSDVANKVTVTANGEEI
jgi:hypothetical protein